MIFNATKLNNHQIENGVFGVREWRVKFIIELLTCKLEPTADVHSALLPVGISLGKRILPCVSVLIV